LGRGRIPLPVGLRRDEHYALELNRLIELQMEGAVG
jgi:hypothetical protein